MARPAWQVSGQYYETCSCDFVRPCLRGGLAVRPSKGSCTFAMAFEIERGIYGAVSLDGLGFIVLGFTPEAMERELVGRSRRRRESKREQRKLSRRSPAVPRAVRWRTAGTDWDVSGACSNAPIRFIGAARSGPSRLQRSSTWLPKARRGLKPDATRADAPRRHGVSGRGSLRVARAANSRIHALGLAWEDVSGTNNGQYAPFSWRNA